MGGETITADAHDGFRAAYAAHRAAEGRGYSGEQLLSLPYLTSGPFARQWQVRAATFDAFHRRVVRPLAAEKGRSLRVLDLGAGNGWLSYRLALDGHSCTAVDIRDDEIDGLGAARAFLARAHFTPLVAPFDALPIEVDSADIAVFNASLHYATDLPAALAEAVRVTRPGGRIAILDSPFYASARAGAAMVAQKYLSGTSTFGERAGTLLSLPFIEFLTRERLSAASVQLGLTWRRTRVLYPLWYELRPLLAAAKGARAPSRFDFWTAEVS
ncbi:MAG: class I SAM-dependent methyltransferase [Sphingomonas sp.]|uniref:class I SAM-dependent methyltransferase n=1 Tax=Sphingomonas sp. TaxID=28214 RepID=UPI0022744D8F|nr:class I SAM-dependent methyltransferase [Sphingomonas sp.]MCX8477198.1 class I SAM-dependent methyltransferase [Sphingomonas sp.]